MTSHGYDLAKQNFLGSGTRVDMDADVIKIGLLNIVTDYNAPDFTVTSMTGITRYAGTTDQTLASLAIVTTANVVSFDAADATFTAVAISGVKTVGGLIVYKFVTNDAGSTPIGYIDGFTAVTPNGGDITVQFDNGNLRIFGLSG
jgi:hypothetical protein